MPRGSVRTAVLTVCLLVGVACTDGGDPPASDQGEPAPVEREYWPTDEWRTADPADHGFDADEVAELERLVSLNYSSLQSIAIVRNGYLVYERYWRGLDAADGHDTRSVTKSVVGALVGIALADGAIESVDQTMGDLFGDDLPTDADPRMADVTVRHLLSMTSGLPADDPSLGGDEAVFERIGDSPDLARAILGLPLAAEPGTTWAYSSATSHLLSILVADRTASSTLEFARDRLFGPLGIDTSDAYVPRGPLFGEPPPDVLEQYLRAPVAWPADVQGYNFGGALLKLPTRDLAKFGYLYLNQGRWDGEQILPADYVRNSTSPAVRTDLGVDYGWHWWVARWGEHERFFARGYGGQVIEVVPDLDLVVVVTGDPLAATFSAEYLVDDAVVAAADD